MWKIDNLVKMRNDQKVAERDGAREESEKERLFT